jgi:ABC-type nickel/cobalt efflux system permease component RcnA
MGSKSLPPSLVVASLLAAILLAAGLWALTTTGFDPGDAWTRLIAWIIITQRELHDGLATALRAVQAEGSIAAPALVWLGFLYGVFHAAGPGHGKVVITTYLATQKESLGRGIALAATASLLQGLTAIAAVFGTVLLLEQTTRQSQRLAGNIELVSFALIAALGAFLTLRHARRLYRSTTTTPCSSCGHHHHAPPPDSTDRGAFLTAILSIGLRPCTGAILVLVLAIALDLRAAGIAAVLAMSVGTGLSTAALATLATLARDQAARLAAHMDTDQTRLAHIADTIALLGGLALLAMGATLLHTTLTMPAHPLIRG